MPEKIGEVVFIVGICTFATMFFDFGFNTTANTKIAQEKFTPESNIGTLLYYKLILSLFYFLAIIGIFLVNHKKIYEIGLGIFIIITISLFIDGFSDALQQYFVGKRHFYKFMISNFLANFVSVVFLIFISLYSPTKFNYAAAIFIRSIILIIILLFYFRKIKIDWAIRKEIFQSYWQYAKPFMVLMPIHFLIANAEKVILPYLISSFSLGIFHFGLKFYNLAQLVKKTFTSYIYTYVCNIISKFKGSELIEKLDNLTVITQIFATILMVGLINRTDYFMVLLFGNNYAPAAIVSKLMCIFLYLDTILSNYGHIIYATSIHKKLIKWTIVGGFILIISSLLLIPDKLFGLKLIGLDYAGMPLAKLIRILTVGTLVSIVLVRQVIGSAFIKTQLKLTILFISYILLDNLFLSLNGEWIFWVFISWAIGICMYALIVIRLFLDKALISDFKKAFSIKKFKEGLKEI